MKNGNNFFAFIYMFQGEIVPEQENFITWYVKNAERLNGINTRDFFNLLNEYPITALRVATFVYYCFRVIFTRKDN